MCLQHPKHGSLSALWHHFLVTLLRMFYRSHFMPRQEQVVRLFHMRGDGLEVPGPCAPFCLHRCALDAETTRDGHGFSLLLRRKLSTKDMCRCMVW